MKSSASEPGLMFLEAKMLFFYEYDANVAIVRPISFYFCGILVDFGYFAILCQTFTEC